MLIPLLHFSFLFHAEAKNAFGKMVGAIDVHRALLWREDHLYLPNTFTNMYSESLVSVPPN